MAVKQFRKTSTAVYDQSGTSWTHGTRILRPRGVDLVGIKVIGDCDSWNSSTVNAVLQGCINDTDDTQAWDDSSAWVDLETLSFTTDAAKYYGASAGYLVGLGAFQGFRIKGVVASGTPSADVTLSLETMADYEDA